MSRICLGMVWVLMVCGVTQADAEGFKPLPPEVAASIRQRIDAGELAGVAIALIDPDGTTYHCFGQTANQAGQPVDASTIFEIGSISKVFTAVLLEQFIAEDKLKLEDPVEDHLPDGVRMPQFNNKPVTLRTLAMHTSGLPRLPDNLESKDPLDPYADYTTELLYHALGSCQIEREIGSQYAYSNLGMGLLGHVLERIDGESYEQLVVQRICRPLGMSDTRIELTEDQKSRFAKGHNGRREVPPWRIRTLAGAGALRSTVRDLATFVKAGLGLTKTPLTEVITRTCSDRLPTGMDDLEIARGWHISTRFGTEIIWHNGGTGGFRSWCGFRPDTRRGVVVLSNSLADIDAIARHLLEPQWELSKSGNVIALAAEARDRYTLWASKAAGGAERLDRGTVAMHRPDGSVFVGWRLLATDPADVAFHVLGGRSLGQVDRRLTSEPLRGGTHFVYPQPNDGETFYVVQPVVHGSELPKSAPVSIRNAADGRPFLSIKLQDDYTFQKVAVADLDGDGRYEFVIKQPNFNVDPYHMPGYWKKSEDTYKLEAYDADGKPMWRYDMGWSIEQGIWYSPYVVYDLDGDGRAEVYAKAGEGDPRDPDGRVTSGPEWLVKIDGRTGQVLRKLPWPDRSGFENYNYYCRNLLGIAYLDGKRPHLIVQRGTYTQIKIEAYDPDLNLVWKWNSRDEQRKYNSQGAHTMHAADVDGDGFDEIIIGAAVVDHDGKGLWTRETGHPDTCYVGDIDPSRPGLEIFYGIEPRQSRHGVCLADACTGETIWGIEEATHHVHSAGMVADLLADDPGQECYAGERDFPTRWLMSAAGKRIGDQDLGGLAPKAAWWDADEQKELITKAGIADFGGPVHDRIEGKVIAIVDCLGDWREEIITSLPGELRIYSTTIPGAARRICLMQDRLYRTGVAMGSMGYYAPPQLSMPLMNPEK